MTELIKRFRDEYIEIEGVGWYASGQCAVDREFGQVYVNSDSVFIERLDRLEAGPAPEFADFPLNMLNLKEHGDFRVAIADKVQSDPRLGEWFQNELESYL